VSEQAMLPEVSVEVIVPVHDLARPIARTVRSLLAGGLDADAMRVTLVAHNLDAVALSSHLDASGFARELAVGSIRVVGLHDGGRSPGPPRALALQHAAARYVSFVDSDDWIEPGALAAWLTLGDRQDAAAVIALERHARGALVRNPPVRVLSWGALDAGRDRLVYRTALRGLFALEAVRAENLAFTEGGTNGSDQPFTLQLWHSGRRIVLASRRPAYVLGDDAETRITRTVQPLVVELAAPTALLNEEWFAALDARDRAQAATKIVRIHLLPGLALRIAGDASSVGADLETARALLQLIAERAPGARRSLSRVDAGILEVLQASDAAELIREAVTPLLAVRRRFAHPQALLTRRIGDGLRRDAPLRLAAASTLFSLRAARPAARPDPPAAPSAADLH
jgi:hypothetical protein